MHTRSIVVILLLVASAGCSAVAAPADALVTLTVAEPAGVPRQAEPVTTGLPFARGILPKGASVALLDSAGKEVPLQTRELTHWPDASVKWLLLDFQATLAPHAAATYTLVRRGASAKPAQPVKANDAAGAVTVDTGPLQVTLGKKGFDLFSSVQVDGKDALDKAPGGLRITDLEGKVRGGPGDLAPGYRVEVVEAGPLRTVVRATGEVQANDKLRLGFTCWYHFFAGRKDVRVFFTMRNLAGQTITNTDQNSVQEANFMRTLAARPGNVTVKAVELVIPLAKRGGASAVIGGWTQPHELAAGKLYQDSSSSWHWQVGEKAVFDPALKANAEWMSKNAPQDKRDLPFWEYSKDSFKSLTNKQSYVGCSFRGYKVYDGAGKEVARGERAPGWAQVGASTLAVRWFWQMYPKAIEVKGDGTVRLGLWPIEWAELSRPHTFVGHIHKTHELLLAFGQEAGAGEANQKRLDTRLLAVAPKEYYCSTGAFNGFMMPENRKDFARYEDWAVTAVKEGVNPNVNPSWDSSLRIEREKYDHYGVWNFGDTSKRGWRGFGQYLELDIPYCLLVHWARTGNRDFFNEGEIHTRQLMDVPAHGGGYGHQKGESSHYYTSGAFFYYYLTGLEFVLESIKASHDRFAKPAPWHARSFAITMWSNLDLYRQFGEQQYVEKIKADLAWFKGSPNRPAQDPVTGFRGYGQVNFQEFMLGMAMDSIGQYCTLFPMDQEMRDRLVAWSLATMRTHREKKWKQNNSCCNGHTWAWLFSGRDRHLDFACELLDESLRPGDKNWPTYRTGTGSGKYWSEFGHRDTQTHMWARWWRANHGTPKPPAAVADLAATVDGDKVTLTWTAPPGGERYLLKLSAKPLKDDLADAEAGKTAANWWMTPVAGELSVKPADAKGGGKMTMVVKKPGAAVFAALRVYRQVGPVSSASDISNVVEVK